MPRVHLPDGRIVNFPDGMSEGDIAKAMDDLAASTKSEPAAAPQGNLGRFGGYKMIGDAVIGALKTAAQHPIETGALLGGAVAAPLTGGTSIPAAMAAAGLGGAGGAGLGMIANAAAGNEDGPKTAGDVLKRMAAEGAMQAGAEGAGAAASQALKMVGAQAYRGALRPSAAVRLKYPNVVEQGIEDGLIVGPKSSVVKARGLVKDSRQAADDLVAQRAAGRQGVTIPQSEITNALTDLARTADETARAAGTASESGRVAARAGAIPSPTLEEAHAASRLLNDKADSAFRAAQRGGAVPGIESQIDRALASGYSNAVKSRVPGLADQNALTSTRYGLAKALQAAAERPSVLSNVIAGSTGIGEAMRSGDINRGLTTGLLVKGLGSPRALSAAGIGLSRAAEVPIAQSIRAALLTRLLGDTEQ